MATKKVAYGNSGVYQFEVWAIDPPFTPSPYEFTVAEWEISYRATDKDTVGFVPSTCTLALPFDNSAMRNWLTADYYFLKVFSGINKVWVGFITPDLCSIEVINGQRFIQVKATDGFQMLDVPADRYTFTGVKAIASQIAESLNYFDFWDLYDGFAVGQMQTHHLQPLNTTEGTFYWTGNKQSGLWYGGSDWYTFRQALESFCETFRLRVYQDKGILVFKPVYEKTTTYHMYTNLGDHVGNITYASASNTVNVQADGVEMYKPAVRSTLVTLQHANPDNQFYDDANDDRSDWWYCGEAQPTGANDIDVTSTAQVNASVPAGYNDTIEFTWYMYVKYGDYYFDGTNWVTTEAYAFTQTDSRLVVTVSPQLENFSVAWNNQHMATLPLAGPQPFYVKFVVQQTLGTDVDSFTQFSDLTLDYHGGTPTTRVFGTDNGIQRNGIAITGSTYVGDLIQTSGGNSPVDGELRGFQNTARSLNGGNIQWEHGWPITAYNLHEENKARQYPRQYYEVAFTEPITYGFLMTWGGSDYLPLNLSFNERGSTATLMEWVYASLASDPNRSRVDQEL